MKSPMRWMRQRFLPKSTSRQTATSRDRETADEHARHLERSRVSGNVEDLSWTPPHCPEDGPDERWAPVPTGPILPVDHRLDLGHPASVAIGSTWRTTERASIVAPRRNVGPMLALLAVDAPDDRYTIEAGTRLRVTKVYDPWADEDCAGLDMTSFYEWCDGWDSRTYEILDGPSARVRVTLAAGRHPRRQPRSSLAAHATLVPA